MELKQIVEILYLMGCVTDSQCRALSRGVGALQMSFFCFSFLFVAVVVVCLFCFGQAHRGGGFHLLNYYYWPKVLVLTRGIAKYPIRVA